MAVNWDKYKGILESFSKDNLKQPFTVIKRQIGFDRWGEDNIAESASYTMYGVIEFFKNFVEIDKYRTAGRVDKDTRIIYVHLSEVKRVGLYTAMGNVNIIPGSDIIKVNGVEFTIIDFNPVAQAKDTPTFYQITIQPAPTKTGQETP